MKRKLSLTFVALLCALVLALAMAPRDATDTRDTAAIDNAERANREAFANRDWPTPRPTMAAKVEPKQEIKTTMAIPKVARGGTITIPVQQTYENGPYSFGTYAEAESFRINNTKITFSGYTGPAGSILGDGSGITISPQSNAIAGGYGTIFGSVATAPVANGSSGWDVYYTDYQNYDGIEVVCLLAKLALTRNVTTQVITATASYEGTPTGAVTYAFTLPADATDVSGTGNARQFKSASGGDVSVTITDSATPTPCTDTATANTSSATEEPTATGAIELGGFAPTITPTSENGVGTFAFTEPYVSAPNNPPTNDVACAGINVAFWGSKYFCSNFLEKRRVYGETNYSSAAQAFEQVHPYTRVDNTDAFVSLPVYATEARWEFVCRGDYGNRIEGREDDAGAAFNPRAAQNSNGNSDTYSNSTFIVVPATEGAPVDPTNPPPIEPPPPVCRAGTHDDGTGQCVPDDPTGPQPCATGYTWNGTACVPTEPPPEPSGCTIDCSFRSTDKGDNLYRIEAVPSFVQNPPVSASWKRDGAALASTALFVEETIEPNAEAVFAVTLTDGACVVTRSHVQRNEDGGTIEPTIPVDAIPAKPDAPIASGLRISETEQGVVTLSFTNWPANTRVLKLYQNNIEVHAWNEADAPRSFEVKQLELFQVYQFTLQGYNLNLVGPISDSTPVEVKSATLQVAWIKPPTGAEIRGKTALIGRVGAGGVNVQILFNGSALAGVHRTSYEVGGAQVWGTNFNPLGLDFLGNISLRLLAFDEVGLPAFADIAAYLTVTLAKSTRYEHIAWADPHGRNVSKVALTALLDEGDGWVDALVTAPGAGVALPYADYDAMEEVLRDWQSVALDEVFTPLSESPTPKLEAVLRLTPPNLETRYPLNATGATRVRRIDDEKLEVLTFEPARVVEVTPDGIEEILDISARGFENVIDARRWREDKVVVVTQTEVWVCERDASAADWRVLLRGESKPCIAVETLDDAFYLAFADIGGSRVWMHDGTDPTKAHETTEQIILMRASADALAWATVSNQLWSFKGGVAAKLFDHDAPIVEILFSDDGEVEAFADASHVWRLKGEGEVERRLLVGEVAPDVRALGFYKGKNALARLTAGGDAGPAIYSVASSGAWGGIWTLEQGAIGIDGLSRFLTTHVEPEGDPLMGGKPAVTSEILVAVARVPSGGGYVAFIEEAKQTRDTSTRARGVKRLVVVHENKGESGL